MYALVYISITILPLQRNNTLLSSLSGHFPHQYTKYQIYIGSYPIIDELACSASLSPVLTLLLLLIDPWAGQIFVLYVKSALAERVHLRFDTSKAFTIMPLPRYFIYYHTPCCTL
jgi:hypothetical protein